MRIFTIFAALLVACSAPASASSNTTQYARVLRGFNRHLSVVQSVLLADHVRTEASFYRLDPRLLVALVAIESSWHPYVTSPVGAGGLGQLMPGTAAGLGVNAYAPYANLNGTARYLRGLLDRFGLYGQSTRYSFALAGYNAGPGAVERYGGIPPYAETQAYVRNVMRVFRELSATLSAHIDDAAAVRTSNKPPPVIHLAVATPLRRHSVARAVRRNNKHSASAPTVVADLSNVVAPTPLPKRKPFLYYVFHHGHKDDGPVVATAPNGMGPDPDAIDRAATTPAHVPGLALHASASVRGGRPIRVWLQVAVSGPVTLIARIGPTVIAQLTLPPHAKNAVITGVSSADLDRVVVVSAYAQGYNEGHAAITVLAKESTIASASGPAR